MTPVSSLPTSPKTRFLRFANSESGICHSRWQGCMVEVLLLLWHTPLSTEKYTQPGAFECRMQPSQLVAPMSVLGQHGDGNEAKNLTTAAANSVQWKKNCFEYSPVMQIHTSVHVEPIGNRSEAIFHVFDLIKKISNDTRNHIQASWD